MKQMRRVAESRLQLLKKSNAELESSVSQIQNNVILMKAVIAPTDIHGELKQKVALQHTKKGRDPVHVTAPKCDVMPFSVN